MEPKSLLLKKKNTKPELYDYLRKVIIIGDSGVGKSNILLRYSHGQFVQNYMMTIGINYVFNIIQIDGMKIKLQIWDTAGQDKYKTITQNYYNKSHGVIIAFGINSRQSFNSVSSFQQNIEKWLQDVNEVIQETTPIILVGNKMDLEEEREVETEEAEEFAKINNIQFVECSAKSGQSIKEAFQVLGRLIKERIIDPKLKSVEVEEKGIRISKGEIKLEKKCCYK